MRRLTYAAVALALTAAACGNGPEGRVSEARPEGFSFVTQVVDFGNDLGHASDVATGPDGSPRLSYLGFLPPPMEGEPPPMNDPLEIQYPAVLHARFVEEVWTRTPVAEHVEPGEDEAQEDVQPDVAPEDATAIAVDGDGAHHVAWTAGRAVWYANDAEGEEFGEPARVATGDVAAPGIAIAGDGSPRISFYAIPGGEAGTGIVRVATPQGDRWDVETVAEASMNEPLSTGIATGGGQTLVGYESEERIFVVGADGGESEEVDSGTGVGLALDPDGNPHVSYYDGAGGVKHAHSIAGSPWEVSDVGETDGPDPLAETGIALDEGGTHHVVWDTAGGIGYANNEGGPFEEEEVLNSEGGTQPSVGAGGEGVAYVGFYDPEGLEMKLSIRTEEEFLLGVPGAGETPTAGPSPAGDGEEADVDVTLLSFDVQADPASAPAGDLTFGVTSADIGHNFFALQTQDPADGLASTDSTVDLAQYDVAASIEQAFDQNAGQMTASGSLEAGRYVLICNVPGHYDAGMRTEFTIE